MSTRRRFLRLIGFGVVAAPVAAKAVVDLPPAAVVVPEHMLPSAVNDSARRLMAAVDVYGSDFGVLRVYDRNGREVYELDYHDA